MRMKKSMGFCALIAILWGMMGWYSASETEAESDEKYVIVYPGVSEDNELLSRYISEITEKELGISVEIRMLDSDSYSADVKRMMSNQEQIDICFMSGDLFWGSCVQNRLVELTDLLEQYGTDICREVGVDTINVCRLSGELYGVPNNHDFASGWDSYVLDKEILEKYGIDETQIKTYEDLEAVFAYVHEHEPELCIVQSGISTMGNNQEIVASGNPLCIAVCDEKEIRFENLFASEQYADFLKRIRRWYELGYMSKNAVTDTLDFQEKMSKGELFSYTTVYKPGILNQERQLIGRDVAVVQLGKTTLSTSKITTMQWVITENTISEETSMQLLNLLYSNADIMNLMANGVEGIHYQKNEEGFLCNIDGQQNPYAAYAWRMPNQFITDIWEGDSKNLWEEMRQFNERAEKTPGFGFLMDLRTVYPEYQKIREVYNSYKPILENGMVEPMSGNQQMIEALNVCGYEAFLDEINRQWKKWQEGQQSAD